MKTLGLIGGISWASTAEYYKHINLLSNRKLGGSEFIRCIVHSLNFGDIVAKNKTNDHDGIAAMMTQAAVTLQNAGADAIVICANTMHMHANLIQQQIQIPIIHIVAATANEINKHGLKTVALLGTKYTMELDFFKKILSEFEISTIVPEQHDREFIHRTIYEELVKGIFSPVTKQRYTGIIDTLMRQGAEGVILGCTEIPLLIQQSDCSIPCFDTTLIHANAAVEFALSS